MDSPACAVRNVFFLGARTDKPRISMRRPSLHTITFIRQRCKRAVTMAAKAYSANIIDVSRQCFVIVREIPLETRYWFMWDFLTGDVYDVPNKPSPATLPDLVQFLVDSLAMRKLSEAAKPSGELEIHVSMHWRVSGVLNERLDKRCRFLWNPCESFVRQLEPFPTIIFYRGEDPLSHNLLWRSWFQSALGLLHERDEPWLTFYGIVRERPRTPQLFTPPPEPETGPGRKIRLWRCPVCDWRCAAIPAVGTKWMLHHTGRGPTEVTELADTPSLSALIELYAHGHRDTCLADLERQQYPVSASNARAENLRENPAC